MSSLSQGDEYSPNEHNDDALFDELEDIDQNLRSVSDETVIEEPSRRIHGDPKDNEEASPNGKTPSDTDHSRRLKNVTPPQSDRESEELPPLDEHDPPFRYSWSAIPKPPRISTLFGFLSSQNRRSIMRTISIFLFGTIFGIAILLFFRGSKPALELPSKVQETLLPFPEAQVDSRLLFSSPSSHQPGPRQVVSPESSPSSRQAPRMVLPAPDVPSETEQKIQRAIDAIDHALELRID